MPYIAQKDRQKLDPLIESLSDEIVRQTKSYGYDGAFAGLLNYTTTHLTMRIVQKQFGGMRYWLIATVTGTFKNIADEFYRRVAVPYEELQIYKSGDVSSYEETLREMQINTKPTNLTNTEA